MTEPSHLDPSRTDPFGTGALRERVLRAWAESPARFREDANAEEDYALGGYRDRVIVELAQNAADAAARAGVPGRLWLSLRDGVLVAANNGAPLDAPGVEALSTLRASAKRDDAGAVGRFGVGFAAVVAVSDSPSIAGVEWSAVRARELAARIPTLADELQRRGGHVPLLRLPFPLADPQPPLPEGATTVVRLPLRDAAADALVRDQLGQVGPALMLALPALATIEIDVEGAPLRTLTADHDTRTADDRARTADDHMRAADDHARTAGDRTWTTGEHARTADDSMRAADDRARTVGDRTRAADQREFGMAVIDGVSWRTVEAHGLIPVELLADRPTEERARPTWQVRWAMPEAGGLPAGMPAVLHAPTPSDERLDLPALLIASFPLAPDRRHVAPGALTGFLAERAAEAYVQLLRGLPATTRLLDLIPGPVGAGELDAAIRRAVLARLPETPLLPAAAAPDGEVVRGRDAVAVDGPPALIELLSGGQEGTEVVVPGLLPAGWPVRHQALGALGVRRMELADVVDDLAALDREPAWWRRLYEAFTGASTDSLGALPVPLAGEPDPFREHGARMVRGPRGLLVATDGIDPAGLGALGLRFVHPEAEHPLLLRLGAIEAGPRTVLADPAVRAAVEGSFDADDPELVAAAVLGLAAAAHLDPGTEPWLAELALPGDDGDLYPAGELLLPGSPLRDIMADDAPFGVVAAELVERWGPEPLESVGVLNGFALARGEDVNLAALADLVESFDLDGEDLWADEALERLGFQDLPPLVPEFQAVRDLELVADWDAALRALALPPWRAALVEPAHVMLHDGRRLAVPSYTAWWLGRHPVLDGRRPGELRFASGSDPLAGLYDVVSGDLDREVLLALGVRTSLAGLLAEPGGAQELLDRMADPARTVARGQLSTLWTALADLPDGVRVRPPERVRAVVDGEVEVAEAADALILDRPDLLPLLVGQPLIIAASGRDERLAELLDLPVASEEIPGVLESPGEKHPVPHAVRAVLPDAPDTYLAHERLVVDGQPVSWWCGDGEIHAAGPEGLARGLAWTCDRWEDRLLLEAVLRDPSALPTLQAESDLHEA
ncbi:sacsin N-terminal ATP-binding-like domain-containing protein [Spirillospora sp. NPDC048911]|uniref:sacsin N-terminal ATP-binding-like domain-containing protein n=1 Tax=Spirillospora sp. NPDC048911 TaxID=3364527 RepID=UPI00371A88DB